MAKSQSSTKKDAPICYYIADKHLGAVKGKVSGRVHNIRKGATIKAKEGDFEGIAGIKKLDR